MADRKWFLIVCAVCDPHRFSPVPFPTPEERSGWATEHRQSTRHDVWDVWEITEEDTRPTVTIELAAGRTKRRPAECPYYPTMTPGLVIAELPSGRFAATHLRSGATVGHFPTVGDANRFVLNALNPLGLDWTGDAESLNGKLPASLEHAVRLLGGAWRGHKPTPERQHR